MTKISRKTRSTKMPTDEIGPQGKADLFANTPTAETLRKTPLATQVPKDFSLFKSK